MKEIFDRVDPLDVLDMFMDILLVIWLVLSGVIFYLSVLIGMKRNG